MYHPFIMSFFLPSPAHADEFGIDKTAGASGLDAYSKNVPELTGNLIGSALSLIAVIFFVLVVYGGFRWMFARGNEEDTKKALGIITAASIGLIITLASYAVTNFVLENIVKQ